jgi:hypothetical protein
MSGEQIARALGLSEAGGACWHGPCPCCGYRSGFSVAERRNGLPLVHCNAGGCGQTELVAALRRRGLWPDHDHNEAHNGNDPDELARRREAKARQRSRKIELAPNMWREASPASGTLIETYLRSRDIVLPVPPVIRILGMHGAYGRAAAPAALSGSTLPPTATPPPSRRPPADRRRQERGSESGRLLPSSGMGLTRSDGYRFRLCAIMACDRYASG